MSEQIWIEWSGGLCPVERGTLVDVRFRDGVVVKAVPAGDQLYAKHRCAVRWSRYEKPVQTDIVAYRVSTLHPQAVTDRAKVEEAILRLRARTRCHTDDSEPNTVVGDIRAILAEFFAQAKALDTMKAMMERQDAAFTATAEKCDAQAATIQSQRERIEALEEMNSRLLSAIDWLDQPFIDETTPASDFRSRTKFMLADRDAALNGMEIPPCEGCGAPSDPSIIDYDGCDLCAKCAAGCLTPPQDQAEDG